MKKVYISLISALTAILLIPASLLSQVPEGFTYQAVARDASGNPVTNTGFSVRIGILTNDVVPDLLWEEEHQVTSNDFGLFILNIGVDGIKTGGSLSAFSEISWAAQPLSIRTSIKETEGDWQEMDPAGLLSVPYALVAKDVETKQQISKSGNSIVLSEGGEVDLTEFTDDLTVVSTDDSSTEALFEVKRNDGQPVFAVYPNGVKVFVDDIGSKGPKGGFAIGGFDRGKGVNQDFMIISPDSIRMFMPNNPSELKGPGSKGGFAIGGFDASKGIEELYFTVSGKTTTDTYESSPRILWYPLKEAFLAGRVHIGSPDSVGQNSTALGYHSIAMGNYSQAFGNSSKALADNTTAIGFNAVAAGPDSYAFGSGAEASGERSFAFGSIGIDEDGNPTGTPTSATGAYSVALGMGAQATNKGAMALGVGAESSGYSGTSMGFYSTAGGSYSNAIGYRSDASALRASAFGAYANADGNYSLSLGYSSDATQSYSVSIGYNAQSTNSYSTAIGFNPTASNQYSTAIGYQAKATGLDSYSFGSRSEAAGERSFAIGTYGLNTDGTPNTTPTKAQGNYSLAMGMGTQSLNLGSIAMGVNSLAENDYAVAIGNGATASGAYSTSVGYITAANGDKAISIGAYYNYTYYRFMYNPLTHRFEIIQTTVTEPNVADGDYSISFGNGNYSNNGGLAIGTHNDAKEIGSVALGHTNYADSAYSFAAGYNNYARAQGAFALGQNNLVQSLNGFAVGRYNSDAGSQIEWIDTDPLFMVGNGSSSGARSNAFVVYKNGNAYIDGDLTVSGNISASVTGDGLGSHVATQNLNMNGNWLSGDGSSEGVFVTSSGTVGINDGTPSYTFDVSGTGRFTSNLYANSNMYTSGRLEVSSGTDASGTSNTGAVEIANSLRLDGDEIITNTDGILYIQNDNNGDLQVDQGTFFIDASTDRVGIGTASPAYKLDVAGSVRTTSTLTASGRVTGASFMTGSWEIDNETSPYGNVLMVSYSKAPLFAIAEDGELLSSGAYNTTVGSLRRDLYVDSNGLIGYVSSSIRYKKDVKKISDVSWIYDLNPVTYKYKSDETGRQQFGLIAEEVEKVNPLFVSYTSDGMPETVLYSEFITPLLKAVQEQNSKSDDMIMRFDNLRQDNERLMIENEELRARLEQLESIVRTLMEK